MTAVDLLRHGPWAQDVPSWIGAVAILPGRLFAYQLGAARGTGRIRRRGNRLLRRPAWWAPVVVLDLSAMTVFCWHRSAMAAVAVPGAFLGPLPGLTTAPDSPGWVAARLCRLPMYTVVV